MQYYLSDRYPLELVISEELEKEFTAHNHVNHYVISLVLRGKVELTVESLWDRDTPVRGFSGKRGSPKAAGASAAYSYREGELFSLPPYVTHAVSQTRDARLATLCIGVSMLQEQHMEQVEMAVKKFLTGLCERKLFTLSQKNLLLRATEKLGWDEKGGCPGRSSGQIGALAHQLVCRPEQVWTTEMMAENMHLSKYHFIRAFKKTIGMTPHRFQTQNRVRSAQGRLMSGKNIAEISAEMGFYDQSHFDKSFRQIVGISPTEYMRSCEYL